MLSIGVLVVHPRYGPAVVDSVKTMTYKGQTRQYFCLRLMKNDDSVMIPEDAAEKIGLRMEMITLEAIQEVFMKSPLVMDDDFRIRRNYIDEKLKSTDPYEQAMLLRDLCWHDDHKQLTRAEQHIRDNLMKSIASELSMVQKIETNIISERLEIIMQTALSSFKNSATYV